MGVEVLTGQGQNGDLLTLWLLLCGLGALTTVVFLVLLNRAPEGSGQRTDRTSLATVAGILTFFVLIVGGLVLTKLAEAVDEEATKEALEHHYNVGLVNFQVPGESRISDVLVQDGDRLVEGVIARQDGRVVLYRGGSGSRSEWGTDA